MNISYILIIIFLSMFIGYCFSELLDRKRKGKTLSIPGPQEPLAEKETLSERKLMAEEAIAIIEKLGETISLFSNLSELAHEIVKTTSRILNVEICVLLLLDENADILSAVASVGITEELVNTINIKKGEEISGVVAKFNEMKIINDLEREAPLYNLKYDTCYKNSLISIPLSVKNKVMGVLNISSRKTERPFSAVDVDIMKIIALESAIAIQNFKLFQEQQKNYLHTIIALASAIDARDPYTYRHSQNVTKYAVRIAQEMKFDHRQIENIRQAGLLHDIGKIAIKDAVLMKPGKLTDEEYLQIKIHPSKGEEIIKSLPFLRQVVKIIKHHHERFDGKGYPDGIKGDDIELGARILAVADAFDAMTTNRAYRNALTLEETKNELIKNKGTQFDPYIADYFLRILEKEPGLLKNSDITSA